jgi:uncharacterized protein DUF4349
MTTDAILVELRSLPGAPDTLRERVRALPEPTPRAARTLPRVGVRRALLAVAPAAVAVALGAAALHGVVSGDAKDSRPEAGQILRGVQHGQSAGGGGAGATVPSHAFTLPKATAGSARDSRAVALPPSSTRLNRYEAWLRVRVDDAALSRATTRAMQIARGYGGYVSSVDMNTPGERGTSSLVLRVPVAKVEDAVMRLGKLGVVTAQHVRIQDLQRQANVLQRQILQLRTTIAKLEQKLADPTLTEAERLPLQYQLQEAKRELAQTTQTRAGTIREGTLATVSMTLFVPQPAATAPHRASGIERTLREAGSFLLLELVWLVYALVVIGPIALLALAVVLGVRAARRRSDARLLEGT